MVEMGQRMDSWEVSLEAPVLGDSEDEQKNFYPASGPAVEDIVASHEIRDRVFHLLSEIEGMLNEKELLILNSRLLSDEPETLQNIADRFQISRERVRQIEANLLKKLKAVFEKELPDARDFLAAGQADSVSAEFH